jgi:hypothetical protein
MTIQITSVVPRDMMTEEEAYRAGSLVLRLNDLRNLRDNYQVAHITTIGPGKAFLDKADFSAVISLLIERTTAELTMLGVKPKETPE